MELGDLQNAMCELISYLEMFQWSKPGGANSPAVYVYWR